MSTPAQSLLARLEATARDDGKMVHRIRDILGMPFRGRHITNFVRDKGFVEGIPLFDALVVWNIKQEGLRISKGGATAKYGDGAYCFAGKTDPPSPGHFFIDLEIPPRVGVEQITIPGIALPYYRFLPAQGNVIRGVKIINTNITMDALDRAREFMKNE